ncbi:LGFP repeat-containing protein [Streptomyces leeuwenhoekii]|uniref:LGFP Repeat-Containing Protein n=1 Tax=Streptomyces leeuwenhoekii TaxID=1437453 RepID=A0A0F7VLP3_STRLW|nr:hypothetical protein [Streptomyces leeuwenhoekii]CQR60559.1 LGFP Repeat-Containing Protein [Streptomyces leeuwenhoekii]
MRTIGRSPMLCRSIFTCGTIYWTPQTGPHEVHGQIRDLWAEMGRENSFLHYPASDETGSDS